MPQVNGKAFPYTIKGITNAQKELESLGQQREMKKLEETKERIRANKRRSKIKAPVRKALRTLGYVQSA